MFKRPLLILVIVLTLATALAKTKPLNFENPGNRRLMKTETENYYYYRSLPERSMTINVDGISSIELRSFAIEDLRKPQVIAVIDKKSTTYDLALKERLDGYYIYTALNIPVPKGTKTMEVLCYDRSIYFRAFYNFVATPKPKVTKLPNLLIKAHGGILNVTHNGSDSDYYVFNPSQSFKFTLNNQRNAEIYIRARLLDRTLPVFDLYRNGVLLSTNEFSLKRTTKYKAVGIDHMSIGMKLELPPNAGTSEYELRARSEHLFLARPVLLKKK